MIYKTPLTPFFTTCNNKYRHPSPLFLFYFFINIIKTMFFVKGKSHLLSFSNPLVTGQTEEDGLVLLEESELIDSTSSNIHQLLNSIDMLPTFLLIASSMSLIAYLYTILLIPIVLTATLPPAINNQTIQNATNATLPNIYCPALLPRTTPVQNVHDLRPDDIRIVIGIGDSVMAAFAAKGVQNTFFNMENLYENRGISFAMGGVKY